MSATAAPAGIRKSSFVPRALTAAAYGIAVLGGLWYGPLATALVFGLMAGFAASEFYALGRRESRLPNEVVGICAAAASPLVASHWGLEGLALTAGIFVAASLAWHAAFARLRIADTVLTVFGFAYTGLLLSFLVLIRASSSGLALALAVVLSVWVNDVAAYLVGSAFGRHKMAPRISPNKSWEGFFAGVAATISVWLAVPWLAARAPELAEAAMQMPALLPLVTALGDVSLTTSAALGIGLAIALAAIEGDLVESRFKREVGVKDSGNSLPGHGGFLDRLDSLILVSVVAYCALILAGVA